MKYLSVAEARAMPGLRLALSTGSPGPWGISARALFDIRKVPYVPVGQILMQANADLLEWTGRRNAPVAIYDDEPAVDGWHEIANLAERLGSGPSLFPDDPVDRALAVGFSAEICGEGGFGWSRRISMMASGPGETETPQTPEAKVMARYGVLARNVPGAVKRTISVLNGLSAQLHRQRQAGSDYLVGKRLSLCDVHWACFSMLVAPLDDADCPAPERMRTMFSSMPEEMRAALDSVLIEHRERVWHEHIGLPLDYIPE